MRSWSGNRLSATLLFLLAGLIGQSASAQTITEVIPLSFGEIVIPSFASVARVTINPSGGFSTNSNVYLITDPQRGEYLVTGPINTSYTVSIPPSILLVGPGSVTFLLDDLAISPSGPYTTDGAGNDTFYISGKIESQGGGVPYFDGTYDSNLPITLNF